MKNIKLSSPQDVCNNLKPVGIHGEEPKNRFFFLWTESLKGFFCKIWFGNKPKKKKFKKLKRDKYVYTYKK